MSDKFFVRTERRKANGITKFNGDRGEVRNLFSFYMLNRRIYAYLHLFFTVDFALDSLSSRFAHLSLFLVQDLATWVIFSSRFVPTFSHLS